MYIDGKQHARELRTLLQKQAREKPPKTLGIVMVGNDPVSARYVRMKKKLAEHIGVEVREVVLPHTALQEEVESAVTSMGADPQIDGMIVQLPLPDHIDRKAVLAHIPGEKDIDALGPSTTFYSPMVEVVRYILDAYAVSLVDKKVVVVGQGKLVGKPIADWLRKTQTHLSVADITTEDLAALTHDADIVITGAGSPHLIQPAMIQEGVILIDAGTSESAGKLVGDIDPACEAKASLYTPVPGGVGPLTVVMLFKNLFNAKH